jgi:hypothetical protein
MHRLKEIARKTSQRFERNDSSRNTTERAPLLDDAMRTQARETRKQFEQNYPIQALRDARPGLSIKEAKNLYEKGVQQLKTRMIPVENRQIIVNDKTISFKDYFSQRDKNIQQQSALSESGLVVNHDTPVQIYQRGIAQLEKEVNAMLNTLNTPR